MGIETAHAELDLFSEYDGKNAAYIYRITYALTDELNDRDMGDLFSDIEGPVLLTLAKMEALGIEVDRKKLENLYQEFLADVDQSSKLAIKEAGEDFNVNSPKQLQVILF